MIILINRLYKNLKQTSYVYDQYKIMTTKILFFLVLYFLYYNSLNKEILDKIIKSYALMG